MAYFNEVFNAQLLLKSYFLANCKIFRVGSINRKVRLYVIVEGVYDTFNKIGSKSYIPGGSCEM